ncbi:RES family NAD+ phosphorylase [Chitinibacter tainanensis]|uniref:RES family NAD+ phosphorylase n=1 Tax=Chitinibacter tainanensis TaxID=230667 RepID=UPI00048BB455|nr:RES family NAD+ phosphorylase [Chitinibacter tainanensis]
MKLYRISNYADLQGEGGRRFSARWHHKGEPIVYLGESVTGCMLEVMVHIEADVPDTFKLSTVETNDASVQALDVSSLPTNWRDDQGVTKQIGTEWLADQSSALLRVPSAIAPETWNYLLNPKHPDAAKCEIVDVDDYPWDKRLF